LALGPNKGIVIPSEGGILGIMTKAL
jgi:hypothetical protein